jgi:hypothetical protein
MCGHDDEVESTLGDLGDSRCSIPSGEDSSAFRGRELIPKKGTKFVAADFQMFFRDLTGCLT